MSEYRRLVVGVSGASGALYGAHFVRALMDHVPGESQFIISPAAIRVFNEEMDASVRTPADYLEWIQTNVSRSETRSVPSEADPEPATKMPGSDVLHRFEIQDYRDIGAKAASGSNLTDGMAIIPCSMKTMASIAHGLTQNLIERAADVTLKERRTLALVPRESPYSLIHLRNMTSVTEAGATVIPASPGFYQKPNNFDDLGRFIANRVLSILGIPVKLYTPWLSD